jgi:hypothetical protein
MVGCLMFDGLIAHAISKWRGARFSSFGQSTCNILGNEDSGGLFITDLGSGGNLRISIGIRLINRVDGASIYHLKWMAGAK